MIALTSLPCSLSKKDTYLATCPITLSETLFFLSSITTVRPLLSVANKSIGPDIVGYCRLINLNPFSNSFICLSKKSSNIFSSTRTDLNSVSEIAFMLLSILILFLLQ